MVSDAASLQATGAKELDPSLRQDRGGVAVVAKWKVAPMNDLSRCAHH